MTYRAPETNDSAPLAQQIEQMIEELPGDQVRVGTCSARWAMRACC